MHPWSYFLSQSCFLLQLLTAHAGSGCGCMVQEEKAALQQTVEFMERQLTAAQEEVQLLRSPLGMPPPVAYAGLPRTGLQQPSRGPTFWAMHTQPAAEVQHLEQQRTLYTGSAASHSLKSTEGLTTLLAQEHKRFEEEQQQRQAHLQEQKSVLQERQNELERLQDVSSLVLLARVEFKVLLLAFSGNSLAMHKAHHPC
jgi:hypothetical protein